MTLPVTLRPRYNFSGSVTAGTTPQLVLPRWTSRSYLLFENTSSENLVIVLGPATATATITNGTVSSITPVNAGFGYTFTPSVQLIGGGVPLIRSNGLSGGPESQPPTQTATASAVLSGDSISSFVVNGAGHGYVGAPYVHIIADPGDPYGAAVPSATYGMLLLPGGSYCEHGDATPLSQIAVYGATTGQTYFCEVSP